MYTKNDVQNILISLEDVAASENIQDMTLESVVNKINMILTGKGLDKAIYVDYVCYKEKDSCNLIDVVIKVEYNYSEYRNTTEIDISISSLQNKKYITTLILEAINKHIIFMFAEKNVQSLNERLADVAKSQGYVQRIKFVVSNESIVDIFETYVVLGITEEYAYKLGDLQLFNLNKLNKAGYETMVGDVFKSTIPNYSFVTNKNFLTLDLGVYTRRNIVNILKERYRYKASSVKEGKTGYCISNGYFCVFKRLNKSEACMYGDNCIFDEVADKYYKSVIRPIEIKTGNRIDAQLSIKGGELVINEL